MLTGAEPEVWALFTSLSDPRFPGSGPPFPVCPLQGRNREKINLQAPRFSAVFSSQLPCLSKALPLPLSPTASHWQPNIECGKQEKQQHCNVTSFGREHCFGYISPHSSWIARPCSRWPCLSLFQGDAVSPIACFFGFKNSTWEWTSAGPGWLGKPCVPVWKLRSIFFTWKYLLSTFLCCDYMLLLITLGIWVEWGEGGRRKGGQGGDCVINFLEW